jgi:hypothetical protein
MGTTSLTLSFAVSLPNSLGIKRLTPAATAASMILAWSANPSLPTIEMTASWSLNAEASDSLE